MAKDKTIFGALKQFAEAFEKMLNEQTPSEEDKNNAIICECVKKMMTHKELDDDDIRHMLNKLQAIYEKNHRHSYSNISGTIYTEKRQMDLECEQKGVDNAQLDFLAENNTRLHNKAIECYSIYTEENKETNEKILIKFHKLYDHINLETVRLREYDFQIRRALQKIEESTKDSQKQIEEFNDKIEKTSIEIDEKFEKKLEKVKETADKMQSEYISILGIFASIVLTFTTGVTYATSIFNNIHRASLYRLVIITLIVGAVLIFILWLLIDFVKVIHNPESKRKWGLLITPLAIIIVAIIGTSIFHYWKGKDSGIENGEQGTISGNQIVEVEYYEEPYSD